MDQGQEPIKIEPPFCQSCGTMVKDDPVKGTNSDGSINYDYCKYCYLNGSFTDPDISLNEMIECVIDGIVNHMETPVPLAREYAETTIPTLKRWKMDE